MEPGDQAERNLQYNLYTFESTVNLLTDDRWNSAYQNHHIPLHLNTVKHKAVTYFIVQ